MRKDLSGEGSSKSHQSKVLVGRFEMRESSILTKKGELIIPDRKGVLLQCSREEVEGILTVATEINRHYVSNSQISDSFTREKLIYVSFIP